MPKPSVSIIGTRGYPSYYGGFETLVRHLAPYLVDAGWDVNVYSRPDDSTIQGSPTSGVQSTTTRGINTRALSTPSYGLTSSIDAAIRKPSVALIMNIANGYWLPLLKARGIPAVVNVDGLEWDRNKWGSVAKQIFKTGATITAKTAHTIICDSREISSLWLKYFGRAGMYIPYGADELVRDSKVPDGLRHRGYILAVARFVPENSIADFFGAIPRLSLEHDVVIVGSTGFDGPFDQEAALLAANHPKVHWYGHISDDQMLQSLWSHAGVYFHGHTVGGTNPALVQAMACGAPTLAVDTPFNREVLLDCGEYVQPTPRDISTSASLLMNDPQRQQLLSESAKRRATDAFLWDDVCRQYLDALTNAIQSPSELLSKDSR